MSPSKSKRKRAVPARQNDTQHDSDRGSSSSASSSSLSSVPSEAPAPPPAKKPKRAQTRNCPVCDEPIPVRLLAAHSDLETKRVDYIIKNVGSTEILHDEWDHDELPNRRSALRAKKLFSSTASADTTLEQSTRTIQAIKRRRKQRHGKLKEMVREDDDDEALRQTLFNAEFDETTCPVCLQVVRGDEDVVEAHVNACLAHETSRLEEEEEQRVGVGSSSRRDGGEFEQYIGNVSGTRGKTIQDVEDDVDVDGEDAFGDAQFTEGDIFIIEQQQQQQQQQGATSRHRTQRSGPGISRERYSAGESNLDVDVDVTDDDGQRGEGDEDGEKTLRGLIAEGKIMRRRVTETAEEMNVDVVDAVKADRIEKDILDARKSQDSDVLIAALENKVQFLESMHVSSSASLLCRICLDPYAEPTTSTGCWHTCCRECWLMCLGSTKLCPICKRITAASDLRRIYL